MFNPLKMAGDIKGMEKMLKPALEKFMKESGFVKKSDLDALEKKLDISPPPTHKVLLLQHTVFSKMS